MQKQKTMQKHRRRHKPKGLRLRSRLRKLRRDYEAIAKDPITKKAVKHGKSILHVLWEAGKRQAERQSDDTFGHRPLSPEE